ncbi:MAG: glycosyltransferase [Candidatus Omnitrophota bacterium]|jgi:glycosyltransferase involved in cell wall biosynthesis
MKKIKVLRIIARLNIGGPAIHTILLTEGLDGRRFESLLVYGRLSQGEGDISYYAREKNIATHFVPELKRELNFFSDIIAFYKIYKIIITEQPDIVHTHTAKAGGVGRTAAILYNFIHRNKKIKLVHTFHGHIFDGYFSKIKSRFFIFIERFLALFTCQIITVSESIKNELISLGISKERKIKVIPLGLELDKFLSLPERRDIDLNIGIIGRLVPVKNHRLFLEAAAMVISDNQAIRIKFKVIGDGELRGMLEEYSRKLKINNYLDFLGWQKDLVKAYSGLDIVALTSINEGTPVSLIEAMASGKAVVATDVGGIKDLLGDETNTKIKPNGSFKILERGIMVMPGDSLGFAQALNLTIQDGNLRREMGLRARNFAKTEFTKDRLIKDVESLYLAILSY